MEWQQSIAIRHGDLPEASLVRQLGRAVYNSRSDWTVPLGLILAMSSQSNSVRLDYSYADLSLGKAGRAAFWGRRCLLHDEWQMTSYEMNAWEY